MIIWEYLDTVEGLDGRNWLGKEGWELVAVSMAGTVRWFHFKRAKQ